VSPTKQAKGANGKEPKLHQLTEWRGKNKPWEKPDSVGRPVLLWPMNEQCLIMIHAALMVRLNQIIQNIYPG